MFKFILLTLLIVGASMASAADGVGGYDETADVVEMAFEAADAFDNADTIGDDAASEEMGYRYNDGDLEDNINIAINAAILDKYGQAVTSERTNSDEVAAKSEQVPQLAKAQTPEKSAKSLAFGAANKVDSGDEIKNTADKVTTADKNTNVDNGQQAVKATKPVAAARSENTDTITRFVSQVNADGTYGFDFEQSSGLAFKEFGQGGLYAEGSYQYISPEGEHISVTYKADENGFHPESDSLPTPPPIPSYILKALEYIREHPTAEELADREVRAKQI